MSLCLLCHLSAWLLVDNWHCERCTILAKDYPQSNWISGDELSLHALCSSMRELPCFILYKSFNRSKHLPLFTLLTELTVFFIFIQALPHNNCLKIVSGPVAADSVNAVWTAIGPYSHVSGSDANAFNTRLHFCLTLAISFSFVSPTLVREYQKILFNL